jgi:long-chain acyl-CoA synthetase
MPHAFALCILSELAKNIDKIQLTKDLSAFLKSVNDKLEHHERIAKLIVLKEEWTIENGVLTPTLKIKRNVIDGKYQSQYAGWSIANEMVIFCD